jgi:hypothetical protein
VSLLPQLQPFPPSEAASTGRCRCQPAGRAVRDGQVATFRHSSPTERNARQDPGGARKGLRGPADRTRRDARDHRPGIALLCPQPSRNVTSTPDFLLRVIRAGPTRPVPSVPVNRPEEPSGTAVGFEALNDDRGDHSRRPRSNGPSVSSGGRRVLRLMSNVEGKFRFAYAADDE